MREVSPHLPPGLRELWLVRHGATEWNLRKTLQGWMDIPLAPLGREQMGQLARRLWPLRRAFAGIYTSDLRRAQESAGILAKTLQLPLEATPLLREQNMGALTGKTKQEGRTLFPEALAAFEANPWDVPLPQGESLSQVAERYQRFLEDIPEGRHLVVTHSRVIKAAILLVLGAPGHTWRLLHIPNGSLTRILYPQGNILAMGDMAHLEAWAKEAKGGPGTAGF